MTPEAPDLWAQVYHAIREEWAVTAEDIIYRRTTLGLRGLDTPEIRARSPQFSNGVGACRVGRYGAEPALEPECGTMVTARYPRDEELRKG